MIEHICELCSSSSRTWSRLRRLQRNSEFTWAGFVTYFANNHGWLEAGTRVDSSNSNTPSAAGYEALFGVTTQMHPAYPYIQGESKIFLKGHASKGE